MKFIISVGFALAVLLAQVFAGSPSKVVRETAEHLLKRFGDETAEETVETLSSKLASYTTRYGDEALEAVRKVGPRGFQMIDDAGENAPAVIQLVNRYGNDAIWVVSTPRNLAIFVRYGDEAANAMIKHPGVAESAIDELGAPAARALTAVSGQNARRIAMLTDEGDLRRMAQPTGILDVIGKYGDRAADWVWQNKGALAFAAVAAAFIADPEPFLNGTVEVVRIGTEYVVRPIAEEVVESINWNLWAPIAIASCLAFIVLRFGWRWLLPKRQSVTA